MPYHAWAPPATEPPAIVRLGSRDEAAFRCRIISEDVQLTHHQLDRARQARRPYVLEYRVVRDDGSIAIMQECGFFSEDPDAPGYAALLDVTDRRRSEEANWRAAHFDPISGMPNRIAYFERIESVLAKDAGGVLALMILNVDHFREANAVLGFEGATELLAMVGRRLTEAAGPDAFVAHFGIDIFGVILHGVDARSSVTAAARALMARLGEPYHLHGQPYHLTVSVGISAAPEDGVDTTLLMRRAYIAMSAAKAAGRNTFRWYSREIAAASADAGRRRVDLRAAVEARNFEVHYQPIVDLRTRRVVAVEALARWHHPARGWIEPTEFIALADRTGLIVPLGEWIMDRACRQARIWNEAGHDLRMCVNVSAVQFGQADFASRVASILSSRALDAGRLELELTESNLIGGFDALNETLARLRSHGVRLAIDDFGTGYSSLSYLKHLPVDTLKIDRAFVTDIVADPFDRAIVGVVVALARQLGIDCVVEGVEHSAQVSALGDLGCTVLQGFYLCRPADPHTITAFLASSRDRLTHLDPLHRSE